MYVLIAFMVLFPGVHELSTGKNVLYECIYVRMHIYMYTGISAYMCKYVLRVLLTGANEVTTGKNVYCVYMYV